MGEKTGTVYLVGAGPGDPSLITVGGVRALAEADLVLYDALAHPALLAYAPNATQIFVGKRAGAPSARQSSIHDHMLQAARAGQSVVRLKGGDPYLFGRGSEEAEFLASHGVPFEVIPGVPSPLAATAYSGISLTHRTLASSVAYVTASESSQKDESSHDWSKLATATETLVLFMARRRLPALMQLLIRHGRKATDPAAAIENASLPSQRTLVATVGSLAAEVETAKLGTPTLVVVGPVVELRERLRWFDRKPLFGKRVLVTRPKGQDASLAQRLRRAGAAPVSAPVVRIGPPSDETALAQAIRELSNYDWVLFTSQNGVVRFFEALRRDGGDGRRLGNAKIACIGPATEQALRKEGICADLVPDEYRGEALAGALLDHLRAQPQDRRNVLIARAEVAREVLPETLRAAGASVHVVPCYRSEGTAADAANALLGGEVDVVTFTAPSTVQRLVEALGDRALSLLQDTTVASIGPVTTAAAEALGIMVHVTATEYTETGLVEALTEYYRDQSNDSPPHQKANP